MLRNRVVLIAEGAMEAAARALEEAGFDPVRAAPGPPALAAVRDSEPAAVLVGAGVAAGAPELLSAVVRNAPRDVPVALAGMPVEPLPPEARDLPVIPEEPPELLAGGVRWLARLGGLQRELQRADERYRVLYETSPVPYQSLDPEARILAVNDAWLDLLGFPREEVVGRRFPEFLDPETLPGKQEYFENFKRTGVASGVLFELVRRDGERLTVELDGRVEYDSDGRPVRTHCLLRDVTPQRRVQAALRSSEIRYRHLFESAPVSIWEEDFSELADMLDLLRLQGVEDLERYFEQHPEALREAARKIKVLDVNQRTVELFEARSKRDLLESIDKTFVPESFEVFRREVIALARGEPGFSAEAVVKTLHGRPINVLISLTFPPPGSPNKIALISMTDITSRKRAEENLLKSWFAIENAVDGILWLGADGRVEDANRAACALLGYERRDLCGRSIEAIDAGLADWSAEWARLTQRRAIERETFYIARDGRRVPVTLVENMLEFRGRRFVCAFARDRTERERLEAQLRQAQKLETIGRLAGGIAHDFNNILGPILGCADMLLADLPEGSDAHREVKQIWKAALRAKELVGQILLFSRRAEQARKRVVPHLIVREALDLLKATLPPGVRLVEEIDASCDPVYADPTQLHQVVMNLCTNAVEALGGSGGVVTVRLFRTGVPERLAAAHPELQPVPHVCLQVADNGPGITAKDRERLFEPFFTTKENGSGLGLSVVHGIVTGHGGAIDVVSEPGRGACFSVYLPALAAEESERAAERPAAEQRSRKRRTILYVEDQEDVARVVRKMLERQGHEVVPASDGPEALETFRRARDRFDLVITDQTMPSMSGIALARELLGIRPDLPIVLLTGYGERLTADDARAAGIREVVKKPVLRAELAAAVRRALESRVTD
ncbi:MAG: PAS domain S-box protein [Acidobacteria bacterium]|nr:MAG: PAS domain S-box protein [Acidobacteriota bacterium]